MSVSSVFIECVLQTGNDGAEIKKNDIKTYVIFVSGFIHRKPIKQFNDYIFAAFTNFNSIARIMIAVFYFQYSMRHGKTCVVYRSASLGAAYKSLAITATGN